MEDASFIDHLRGSFRETALVNMFAVALILTAVCTMVNNLVDTNFIWISLDLLFVIITLESVVRYSAGGIESRILGGRVFTMFLAYFVIEGYVFFCIISLIYIIVIYEYPNNS